MTSVEASSSALINNYWIGSFSNTRFINFYHEWKTPPIKNHCQTSFTCFSQFEEGVEQLIIFQMKHNYNENV